MLIANGSVKEPTGSITKGEESEDGILEALESQLWIDCIKHWY